jgi:hypothetical protein
MLTASFHRALKTRSLSLLALGHELQLVVSVPEFVMSMTVDWIVTSCNSENLDVSEKHIASVFRI